MRVYKYELSNEKDITEVRLPLCAEILHVGEQGGLFQLWALIDEAETRSSVRKVGVFGTGHEIPAKPWNLRHISTFKMLGGALIFHAFELT